MEQSESARGAESDVDGAGDGSGRVAGALDVFEEQRDRLFGIAYRMLGSVADAEDVLQDAWLKWSQLPAATSVQHPAAYLARTVTNLSLSRLTSATAQRERYVGPWLPEPLVTAPDVAEEVERAESVSLAMLVVLESLTPLERAVFIMREVFGYPYAEVARAVGRSEPAVRQLGHRAKSHVAARRPRFDASAEDQRRVTEEFLAACEGSDVRRMMELLAPDVTLWSDGGGKVQAALRPLHGPDHVARWTASVMRRAASAGRVESRITTVNGRPGVLVMVAGKLDSVYGLEVAGGLVTAVHAIRNPEKLRHIVLDQ